MKNKTLLTAIILGYMLLPFKIQSQNIFPNTGNVGIGTERPSGKLHINGNEKHELLITGKSPNISLTNSLFSLSVSPAIIGISGTNGEYFPSTLTGDLVVTGQSNGNILFASKDSGISPALERMRISNNGRVGIGVTAPEAKLHVNGTIKNSSFDFRNGSGDFRMRRFGAGDVNWKRALVPTYDTNTNKSTLVMNFAGDFEEGVRIAGSKLIVDGNLGLGTTDPQAKVHVANGTGASLSRGGYIIAGPTDGRNVVIDNNEIQSRDNGNHASLFLQPKGGSLYIHYYTENELDRVAFNRNGTVGIGITDTRGYKLAVNGNILTEELKIRTYANWPDYVFEDAYNLKSLEALESEINVLGHLPNIPSAKEVKEGGFNVGEMNARLLEKVEELTLYTINQQKEIEELKGLINDLIKKNE